MCGDRVRAAALLEEAVRIRRATGDGPALADTLSYLAFTYVFLDQPDRALPLFREAAEVRDRLIARVAGLTTEQERLGYLAPIRADLAMFLTAVRARMADQPEAVRLACDLVLRRKAVVTEGMAAERAAVLGGRYPAQRDELQQLVTLRADLAQRALRGPTTGEEEAAHLAERERQLQQLEVSLARQVPELNATRRLRAADASAVAAALTPGSALVEFVRVTPFAHAGNSDAGAWYSTFVLPAGDVDGLRFVDLGPAEAIDELVADMRAAIANNRARAIDRDVEVGGSNHDADGDGSSAAGTALAQHLFEPIAALLDGRRPLPYPPRDLFVAGTALAQRLFEPIAALLDGRRRIFVAPDGELTRLPLEVLPLGNGRLVIDEYTVSYLSAGRDVLRISQPRRQPRGAPVVVADPDYDLSAATPAPKQGRRGTLHFTQLAGMREEGQCIAAMLGVPPLLGADAVETAIKACTGPAILHIATHGFFEPDPADPGRPDSAAGTFVRAGLALAGANTASKGRSPPPEAEDGS